MPWCRDDRGGHTADVWQPQLPRRRRAPLLRHTAAGDMWDWIPSRRVLPSFHYYADHGPTQRRVYTATTAEPLTAARARGMVTIRHRPPCRPSPPLPPAGARARARSNKWASRRPHTQRMDFAPRASAHRHGRPAAATTQPLAAGGARRTSSGALQSAVTIATRKLATSAMRHHLATDMLRETELAVLPWNAVRDSNFQLDYLKSYLSWRKMTKKTTTASEKVRLKGTLKASERAPTRSYTYT